MASDVGLTVRQTVQTNFSQVLVEPLSLKQYWRPEFALVMIMMMTMMRVMMTPAQR